MGKNGRGVQERMHELDRKDTKGNSGRKKNFEEGLGVGGGVNEGSYVLIRSVSSTSSSMSLDSIKEKNCVASSLRFKEEVLMNGWGFA